MADNPALPLWTDALLGDTQHLTQAEFGAYMLMLIVAWRSKECCLPDDDKYLAKITRSGTKWKKLKPVLMAFWTSGGDGQLRQKRLTLEHLRVLDFRSHQSEAGKSSAQKKKERLRTAVEDRLHPDPNRNSTSISIPSTSTNDSSTVVAPDNAEIAAAIKIIDAFDQERVAVFGEMQARAWKHPNDLGDAKRFLGAGADVDLCRSVFRAALERMHAARRQPPGNLAYFQNAIADAIAAGKTPMPEGRNGSNGKHADDSPPAAATKAEVKHLMQKRAEMIRDGLHVPGVSTQDIEGMVKMGWLDWAQAEKAGYQR